MANQKKVIGGIASLLIDRLLYMNIEAISTHMVSLYSDLFSKDKHVHVNEGLVHSIIPSIVTNQENNLLIFKPSSEEIKTTVFTMDGSSAPGLDGFSGIFF